MQHTLRRRGTIALYTRRQPDKEKTYLLTRAPYTFKSNRVIFIYDCDIFTQEYNKHVLGRAIPLEQIDRAALEQLLQLFDPLMGAAVAHDGLGDWLAMLLSPECQELPPLPVKE